MSRLVEIKITPISNTPDVVTTQDAKDYCRVDFNDDDTFFDQLIGSSRQRLERYCNRVFLKANCKAIYEQQGCGDRILLSYSDNMVLKEGGAYNALLVGESYIDTTDRQVILEYTAGYDTGNMPFWMKQAVLIDVAYRYENRGDVATSAVINAELKSFLAPYVNWSLV